MQRYDVELNALIGAAMVKSETGRYVQHADVEAAYKSYSSKLVVDALNAERDSAMSAVHERHLQVLDITKERDTLRDVLTLLAPDLKTMAILYQQQGQHDRAQALMTICKSVGVL